MAVLVSGFAVAQPIVEDTDIDLIDESVCTIADDEAVVASAAQWICRAAEIAESIGIFAWVDGIAWAAIIAIFIARVLSVSLDVNAGPKLRNLLIASMFAFALMLSLTPVRSGMFTVWQGAHEFGNGLTMAAVGSAVTELF